MHDITRLLATANRGDRDAQDQLFGLVARELQKIARKHMHGQRPDHTLQPTVLVDEVFMKLVLDAEAVDWNDRKHFYRKAAKAMRNLLVDHERRRLAEKRGGGQYSRRRLELEQLAGEQGVDTLALHEALMKLEAIDARQAQAVELRYFGGRTVKAVAEILEVSSATVKTDLACAQAWLHRELTKDDD